MLKDRVDLQPDVHESLEMVLRNAEMEARLIDDLLDVTRIARGKIELQRQRVELGQVIDRAVEVCKPDIETRRLHFDVDMGQALPYWVEADAGRLQQVFWNLLKNAIKFTPNDGCVGIRCRRENGSVLVEVNDSGNRAKDHFLAVLSHELRTPLTPVVIGLSMLQNRPDLDPLVRETVEMVRRNVELEARLIDDLLDLSRIARGKVELQQEHVQL